MMQYVRELIKRGEPLNLDERNLISVAFKNTVGPLRTTWRLCESVIRRDQGKNSQMTRDEQIGFAKNIK